MHPLDIMPIEQEQGLHLAIIDLDSAIYKCSAVHNDDEEQGLEFSIDTLRHFVQDNIVNPLAAKNYLFVTTGDDNFRYEVAVTKPYKGQRSGEKPIHHAGLLAWAKQEYNCFTYEGVEADDVVVAVHHKYQGSSILVGIDKDNLQSPGWHYNYSKQEARFLFPIDAQYSLAYQMLTGDAGDNITGIMRVGDKGARNQLSQYECPFDAVWAMYKEKGLSWEYYAEQYQLLYMRRDIIAPFENYFVQLEALSGVEPIEDEEDNKELEL